MLQYHTTSDPETILLLPLTAISPKHSFHWQDKPAMFFIPPNHLAAESIHLDHCLLRVFEFLLPFLPHTICLSSLAPSQQPSFNHFFITPLSLWPVHPHKLPLSFSSAFSPLGIKHTLHAPKAACNMHPGHQNFMEMREEISWWVGAQWQWQWPRLIRGNMLAVSAVDRLIII